MFVGVFFVSSELAKLCYKILATRTIHFRCALIKQDVRDFFNVFVVTNKS